MPDLNLKTKNSHPQWCFEGEEQLEEVRDHVELVLSILDPVEDSGSRQVEGPSEQELAEKVEGESDHRKVPQDPASARSKSPRIRNWSKVTFRNRKLGVPGVHELESEDPEPKTFEAEEASPSCLQTQVKED